MVWANGNSRTSTTHWKRLRNQARRELPNYCAHCGAQGKLELDHIRPHSAGGTDSLDNLQWLCTACHQEKSQGEAAAARRARRQRLQLPRRPHPGLV
ncbi:HNH endonuclease [Corynebacterium striatum]|uniref:HNH endonuclease n=1 Tax=Corynebacterium striatum TaxID=43770 RepID=UPI00254E1681|nr:HNH endonuclease [Corynebacterium striatum]MDK8806795.1 HNH endonuclease [Corynebacterium striatum]